MSQAANAQEIKIALLDSNYVLTNSKFIRAAYETVASSRASLQRLIATAQNELKTLEESGDNKKLAARQAEIQEILNSEVVGLQNEQIDLQKVIKKKFDDLMAKVAKEKSYDLILDKAFVVQGGEDITQGFFERFEKQK